MNQHRLVRGAKLPRRERTLADTQDVLSGKPRPSRAQQGRLIDQNHLQAPAAKRDLEIRRQQVQNGLAIRVIALRKARGWPQDVFARKCGISPATVGQIERGHQDFRMKSLLSIAKGLETTVADLLMGIG